MQTEEEQKLFITSCWRCKRGAVNPDLTFQSSHPLPIPPRPPGCLERQGIAVSLSQIHLDLHGPSVLPRAGPIVQNALVSSTHRAASGGGFAQQSASDPFHVLSPSPPC